MIQFKHVYKSYPPELYALRDVTLHIDKGEFIYLTGPSGAGKTTLFNLISALDRPSSGSVVISGTELNRIDSSQIPFYRRRIGTVYQDFKLITNRNVFENVSLPLEIMKYNSDYIYERVNEVLDQVGLQFKINKMPSQLSGGEKQRVAIARAIIHHPDVLIADEPTGNLDPGLSEDIMDLFEKVNAQGTTVFIATHDHALVKRRKKRIVRIKSGKIFEGNVNEELI